MVEEKKITDGKPEEELGNVEKSHDVMHEVSNSDEEENIIGTFHRGDAHVFVTAPDISSEILGILAHYATNSIFRFVLRTKYRRNVKVRKNFYFFF